MKTLVGGEITGYTEMLIEARQIATKRMVDEAEALEADKVANPRTTHREFYLRLCRCLCIVS